MFLLSHLFYFSLLWIQLGSHCKLAYIVDPRSRKNVITAIGQLWRTFKSILTKEILKNKSNPDLLSKPPAKYGFIEQSHWDSFVKVRLSNEFKVQMRTSVLLVYVTFNMINKN